MTCGVLVRALQCWKYGGGDHRREVEDVDEEC